MTACGNRCQNIKGFLQYDTITCYISTLILKYVNLNILKSVSNFKINKMLDVDNILCVKSNLNQKNGYKLTNYLVVIIQNINAEIKNKNSS